MFPFLIKKEPWTLPTFFFMVMVASFACTFYVYWRAPKKGLSQIVVLDLALIGTIAAVIGARLFHVFVEAPVYFPGYYSEDPRRVLYFWQGGFVGYGAFIGLTASSLLYLWVKKLPVLRYADLLALGAPLIIFFVRIGCLGAGCCYGKPTDFFIHLIFNNPDSDAAKQYAGVALHATQIYDMLNAAITFAVVHVVDRKKKFEGQVMLFFFMSYAFFRFLIEFLRGDEDRGVYFHGAISTSQIVSLIITALCLVVYAFLKNRGPKPAVT